MGNIYVNKSGDDSNGGTSPADAYLTIQKALDESWDGDTIYVGYGRYVETLIDPANNVSVVCDYGTEIYEISWNTGHETNLKNAKIYGEKLRVTYHDGGGILDNIIVDSSSHSYRHISNIRTNELLMRNSIATSNCDSFGDNGGFHSAAFNLENCSIECDFLYIMSSFMPNTTLINCAFKNFEIRNPLLASWLCENCCFDGTITIGGVLYDDLESAIAAYPNNFQNCLEKPWLVDNNYCPEPASPLIDNGKGGSYKTYIGARAPANNYQSGDELFNGATLSNIEYDNTNGFYKLTTGSTTGTITSSVIDYSANQNIRNIFADVDEIYRTDVLDYDNTDVPNAKTYRYRYSVTSEADCLAQSWTEAQFGEDLNIAARWLQIEITFRNDGVEA